MRLKSLLLAAALLAPLAVIAQKPAPTGPPTVAEAQDFMDKAEVELNDLTVEASRAAWVQETHITDDTESIAAKGNERLALRTNEIVIAARRYNKLKLPPALARKYMLLRLNGTPTD